MAEQEFEFVIVGSGAGGGPLAANLARAGYSVALLEAGGSDAPPEYSVPAFYTKATEHPRMRWDHFVRHYADPAMQSRDSKYVKETTGIFYPRAGTLGGCTAHHAMITVFPHAADWDRVAALLDDPSWSSNAMNVYSRRLERCSFLAPPRDPDAAEAGRHGYSGWLPTTMGDPSLLLRDWKILRIALSAVQARLSGRFLAALREMWRAYRHLGGGPIEFLRRYFDPSGPYPADKHEGLYYVPVSVAGGRRAAVREYLLDTAARHPDRLTIITGALAVRVAFDDDRRALGVEYLPDHVLDAAARPAPPRRREPRIVRARREVILAAGAFGSPQLLKLSGIGPRAELEAHGIKVIADRPGVGENLQDRYEISVVNRTRSEFSLTRGATFRAPAPGEAPDPLYASWLRGGGPYATNGAIIACVKRSAHAADPDLFLFSVPGLFRGYFPGFSSKIAVERNYYSWVILKSHTRNKAGRVCLRSSDPTVPPLIDFHYFDEGTDASGEDMDAVVEAIAYARSMTARTRGIIADEVLPGSHVQTVEAVRNFVHDEAWGHHASCSNKMGRADDPAAVVDNCFRVHGTSRLRVVDASVFPAIPGYFIVSAVYMISEKAADLIVADARAER